MTAAPGPEHLSEVAAVLERAVGLHTRPSGFGALRLALEARRAELGDAYPGLAGYVEALRAGDGEELRRLLPLVTVGKTSFFRDPDQFEALAALLPPLLRRARAGGRPVAIWSAGCATGEEVYSIAMTALEAGARPGEVALLGSDVNPLAVEAAAAGCFGAARMADVPQRLIERHFQPDAGAFRAAPELRALARVRPHNLADARYPLPPGGAWDVVFCRNVLIYFETATVRDVVARLHAALAPGGHLFLGYSESLFRIASGFELVELGGAFVYRRPAHAGAAPAVEAPAVEAPGPSLRAPASARPDAPSPPVAAAAPATAPAAARADAAPGVAQAAALMEAGEFAAARALLDALRARHPDDLAVCITAANLDAVERRSARARAGYEAALAIEPLHAETHLLAGVERLEAGDAEGAAQALARALYLDPDLVLAHLYLGRCRERQGDVRRARLAYVNAIEAARRSPDGRRMPFLGYYPDLPEDGVAAARAAEYALAAL